MNRPELNAERFVPDTFTGIPGAKLYRTGDLGYWLADGNIQYLSRNDFQIKVRGFRIEAGDIESVIRLMPGVQDCLVMLDSASGSDAMLVSYVKTADNA
ncbi:non-ribosomal peptide synthetase, partial [Acinetobacter baumannii]